MRNKSQPIGIATGQLANRLVVSVSNHGAEKMKGSNPMKANTVNPRTSEELVSLASVLSMARQRVGRPEDTMYQLANRLNMAINYAPTEECGELDEYLCAVEGAAAELGTFNLRVADAETMLQCRAEALKVRVEFAASVAFTVPIGMLIAARLCS